MPRRPNWTRVQVNHLISLRDVERMAWQDIAEAVGDTVQACCHRYGYHKARRRAEAVRKGEVLPDEPPPFRATPHASEPVPALPKPEPVKKKIAVKKDPRIAQPVQRPRYYHEADSDILSRIDRQGLTAGFLGDPPKGRSALDQKRAGMT